jgi:hypothetical protein
MIVLNIRDYPHITRIFSERIARKLPGVWALEVTFSRIFLRNSDRIKVKDIAVRFGKPDDHFVSPGEPSGTMQAVLKMPHNSIA